ncbi:MAG TPA: tetratricopeptide repeat protein [Terriglobales bacterium]|nr:tetratricopeptide repeat protein [Terriglobales bacterium]
MSSALGRLKIVLVCVQIGALACLVRAQTYKVGDGSSQKPQSNATDQTPSSEKSPNKQLGWGSNIQNARLARAAEQALKNRDFAAAVDYAQRAAQGAPNDPQLWFLLGYAARLDGKFQVAVDSYNRGLHLNPSSLDGISGLAQTYSSMSRTDEAMHLLNQVLTADPKRVNDAVLLGELHMRSGDYDAAINVLGRAEREHPSTRSELLLALSYQHLKQFDQANRYLELAKQRDPNNPEVQRSLAGYYRETGNYPAAIAALKSIHNPKPDVKAELAYTYQLGGKQEEAAKLYAQAANAAPSDLALQLSAAQAQVSSGSIDHAKPFLQRAKAIDAEHYRLHAVLGEIARLQEHTEEAVREYTAAVAHLPENPVEGPLYGIQLHMNLVELYKSLKDENASHQQLEIAQTQINAMDDRGPSRPQFLRLRALVKLNTGDFDGAGKDINEALAINSQDPNSLQLSGDLLAKLGRPDDAIAIYKKILAIDPVNRYALTSLGYVSRESGHDQDAEKYFQKLEAAYPTLYIPYLALGDMYAARKDFAKADASYKKGYELAPANALIVAGGMNAAIEAHHYPLAGEWLSRANDEMLQEPHVMREKERYLSFNGDYEQSAAIGREAIKQLPRDRDVVVYLGYDLLNLKKYDELLQLTSQYDQILPKEPDIPLLAGYVHKQAGQLEQAQKDFTEALDRDPNVTTAYVNRGYVLKDLHQSQAAASDFEAALKLEPKNGEAHLGLAYVSLDMHRPRVALRQVQLAEEEMGDSLPVHLIRATAYGQNGMLMKSASEYRVALKMSPNDAGLHLALADTLYGLHQYHEAIDELQAARTLSPDDPVIYAELARSSAELHERDQTLQYVQLAEQKAQSMPPNKDSKKGTSAVFVSTGQALSALGDEKGAMERFERALNAPNSDRVNVRLAIARLMASQDHGADAQRQIALALMEAHTGETLPPTGEQLMEAADVFLNLHEYQLAQSYLQLALAAGAPDTSVRIGLANTYLALGDTTRANNQLSAISSSADSEPNYQFLLTKAAVLRQEHQNTQALTAFAQAENAAGEDQTAEQDMLQAAANEGLRLNRRVSFLSDFSVAPIFEDTTVYPLDAKLDVPHPLPGRQSLLPPPRSSLETQWTGAYHLHLSNLPDVSGFFQIRNARGQISLPSADEIVNRDTTDYSFNIGLNPSFHLGNNVFTFNTGIQETIRRDSLSPVEMNQNLFRQFVYMTTSSFFNMVSVSGYAIREAGPFTLSNLSSRDLAGALDFRVGRPWGKTALVTGWGARDEQFFPVIREFYYTSAYIGIERKVSERLNFRVLAEDLRAWRVEETNWAIAQALRPAGSIQFSPTRNWSLQASAAYSRNMGFHVYDAVQTGFSVSYAMPIHHGFKDQGGQVELKYPIRFSAGMAEQSFYNFTGGQNQQFRPYVRIDLF